MGPIEELHIQFEEDLGKATSLDQLKTVRDRWLSREQGIVTAGMKKLRELPKEERPSFGQAMNQLRELVESRLEATRAVFQAAEESAGRKRTDVTRPSFPYPMGAHHPIRQLQQEIEEIFVNLGFTVLDIPEAETDYYNFEALNMPRNHPARDAQDTFYFDDNLLLRTHCSPVQVHGMECMQPPIRVVHTGRVYRRDSFDATHSPMFNQIDLLVVDEGITMGDLKGMLAAFLTRMFHRDIRMRLRPGFFHKAGEFLGHPPGGKQKLAE